MDRGSDTGDGTPMGGSKKVHEDVGRLPRALFIFPHFQKTAPTERRCPAQGPPLRARRPPLVAPKLGRRGAARRTAPPCGLHRPALQRLPRRSTGPAPAEDAKRRNATGGLLTCCLSRCS